MSRLAFTFVITICGLLAVGCTSGPPGVPAPGTSSPSGAKFVVTVAPSRDGTPVVRQAPNSTLNYTETPLAITGYSLDSNGIETITVTNISPMDQSIGGWWLYNPDTKGRFEYPSELMLKPNSTVQVRNGKDVQADPPLVLHWADQPQWTGDSDDVLLLNPAGALQFWYVRK